MADPILTASAIPGAPGYAQAATTATNAYQNALARINQNRLSTLRQFGYAGTVDPTNGMITNMHVDPNNPYGNLQSMLRGQAQQSQQDVFAAEERGLHGGLANQAQTADKYAFGQQSSQLGQALTGSLTDFQDQQNQAAYARDSALYMAELQAAQNAIANGDFTPGDFSGLDYPAYGDHNNVLANEPYANKVPGSRNRATDVVARTLANKQNVFTQLPKAAVKIIEQKTGKPVVKKKGGK